MTKIAKRTDAFVETDVDSEIVVMRLDNGDFFSLSGTSAEIWRLIDGSRDRAALLAELKTRFPVDPAEMEADVDEFLGDLTELGLLAG